MLVQVLVLDFGVLVEMECLVSRIQGFRNVGAAPLQSINQHGRRLSSEAGFGLDGLLIIGTRVTLDLARFGAGVYTLNNKFALFSYPR